MKSLQASLTNVQQSLELLSPYLQMFDEFVTTRSETASFWNLYLKMVQLLLDYVSAERDSNILLHVETFSECFLLILFVTTKIMPDGEVFTLQR